MGNKKKMVQVKSVAFKNRYIYFFKIWDDFYITMSICITYSGAFLFYIYIP